jgi:hypothetical protein
MNSLIVKSIGGNCHPSGSEYRPAERSPQLAFLCVNHDADKQLAGRKPLSEIARVGLATSDILEIPAHIIKENELMNRQEVGRRLRGPFAVLALAIICATAAGEDAPLQLSLTQGMRIRILAPDISQSKLVGTIRKVDDQSMTIDLPGRSEPVLISREHIALLDVSEGARSRGVDTAIGAGIGAAIGAAGGALAAGNGKGHIVSRGEAAGIFALLGAGLGALIGAAIPPGERWHEVPVSRYRVSFAPRLDHGLDVAVALNF